MRGEDYANYKSPCAAMAPPSELGAMRMCLPFPLFQLGSCQKKNTTLFPIHASTQIGFLVTGGPGVTAGVFEGTPG